MRVAERAASLNVMIVQSAGNESTNFCLGDDKAFDVNTGNCKAGAEKIRTELTAPFAWASKNYPLDPNPVVVVEAISDDLSRAVFSNIGGDVSAPGVKILSTESTDNTTCPNTKPDQYCFLSGTSMAAPHVTGLIGYILAYNPDLTIPLIRHYLLDFARADTTDDAKPRIDAFASMMAIPGAAKDLVDVNDPTKDGNQRVIIGAPPNPDTVVTSNITPDGKVDMKDFRRFRDAWLQVCQGGGPDCPTPADIVLNGPDNHPAKDLNQDGCVAASVGLDLSCLQSENLYPRFDFNGDGIISLSGKVKVPLKADGTPADNQDGGTEMTDLDVLASQWQADPALTEGWTKTDLPNIMVSGDLEVHADDFFKAGATDVEIKVGNIDPVVPVRHLTQGDNYIVITAPVVPPDYIVEISASATVGEQTLQSAPKQITLKPGQDVRVDLRTGITLTAEPAFLTAGTGAKSTITATLNADEGQSPAGKLITFSISPTGEGHATLSPASGTTDANGKVTADVTAGTIVQDYTITATADLGGGNEVSAKIVVPVKPQITIKYVWQEELLDWWQEGSTRWPTADATMPDCTTAGVEYCIDQWRVELTQPASPLQRRAPSPSPALDFILVKSGVLRAPTSPSARLP